MREFTSFLRDSINSYVSFMKSMGPWHERSSDMVSWFDWFLTTNYPGGGPVLTQQMVDHWYDRRETEGQMSWYNRVVCIRRFLDYYSDRTGIWFFKADTPDRQDIRRIPYPLTEEEIARFFQECDRHVSDTVFPTRKIPSALFRLLCGTGMRPVEARNLKVSDVDLKEGVLSVEMAKNGNARYVPVHDNLTEVLQRYDYSISKDWPDRDYFFPGRNGRLSDGWIAYTFKKLWFRVNTGKAIPYDFRNNFIIQNINSWIGLDCNFEDRLLYLSRYVGHSSIRSTMYYYSIVPQFADTMDRLSSASLDDIIPEADYD